MMNASVITTFGRRFMSAVIVVAAVILAAWTDRLDAQTAAPAPAGTPAAPGQPADAGPPPEGGGLGDLGAMTFGCPKAGLNAAAREAAKVPSQGTYQFSYFKIINDSHHSAYEVHFKSNYEGEAELMYCVSIYCQQGWDPKTTKTSVTLMGKERQRAGATPHVAGCGSPSTPVRSPAKR